VEAREMFDFTISTCRRSGSLQMRTVLIEQADAAILVVRATHAYSVIDRVLEPLPKDRLLGVVSIRART